MPNLDYILQGLRQPLPRGTGKPLGTNNPAELDVLQGFLGDEARSKMRMEQGLGPQANQGLIQKYGGQANDYAADRAVNSIAQQKPMIDAFQQGNYAAASEGFGAGGEVDSETSSGNTPLQSREIYRRKFEQEKMRQPERQTAMEQKGGLERAQEQSRGIIEQAQIGADARVGQANNLLSMLQGGRRPTRVSSGGTSVSFGEPDEAPNAAYQGIENAGKEYDVAASKWWNGRETAMRKSALDAAIQGYFGQLDPNIYSPQVKNYAWKIYNDPDTKDMKTEEIIQGILGADPAADPDELATLEEILRTIRRGK